MLIGNDGRAVVAVPEVELVEMKGTDPGVDPGMDGEAESRKPQTAGQSSALVRSLSVDLAEARERLDAALKAEGEARERAAVAEARAELTEAEGERAERTPSLIYAAASTPRPRNGPAHPAAHRPAAIIAPAAPVVEPLPGRLVGAWRALVGD